MNLIYFVAFLNLGLSSVTNGLFLLQPSDVTSVKTNNTSVSIIKSLVGNPNEFISQVASLDPKKLDEIIVLLEKLVTVSEGREKTLFDTLTTKKAANKLAEDNVITAGTNLDTAKTNVANAKIALTDKETKETTAKTTLDTAKSTQKDKKKEQDTAQKAYDDEKPSLDDEQKILRDVIKTLKNLRGQSPTSTPTSTPELQCTALQQDLRFDPIDFGSHRRTVTGTPLGCAQRCENTEGCIGSSWWPDGGCHIADSQAQLIDASGVTSYSCTVRTAYLS